MHSRTTAQEILADFAGERLDYWVTGFGTGGTLKGVARVLKKQRPETRIIAAEPDNSQVLGSGIPQQRAAPTAPAASHPHFRPHLMQGWSPDFISRLTEDAVTARLVDEIVPVAGNDALRWRASSRARKASSSAPRAARRWRRRLTIAQRAKPGTNIVCMLPDTGERYLSTPLFEDIGEEHDRGGAGDLALDAGVPLRRAARRARAGGRRPRRSRSTPRPNSSSTT